MSFYLFNKKKSAYITIDQFARASLTTDANKAKRFAEKAAINYLNNQLNQTKGEYRIIPCGEDVKSEATTATLVKSADIVELRENPWIKKAVEELNDQLQQCDLQMSDLYHYAYLHPRLPADKGYKLYRILSRVAGRRAEIKIQLSAIQNCTEVRKPYNPRTELYGNLDEIL